MNEHIVWYVPARDGMNGVSTINNMLAAEEYSDGRMVFEHVLELTIAKTLEELNQQLSQGEPAMLVADMEVDGKWEGWELIYSFREKGMPLPVIVLVQNGDSEKAVAVFITLRRIYFREKKPLFLRGTLPSEMS